MHSPEEVIIYLDIVVFVSLIAFFIILYKSSSLFRNKNQREELNNVGKSENRIINLFLDILIRSS